MTDITAQLREFVLAAIESGKETRYSVAKKAGVGYPVLALWLDEGRDIRASSIDALGRFFGLRLVSERPKAKDPGADVNESKKAKPAGNKADGRKRTASARGTR